MYDYQGQNHSVFNEIKNKRAILIIVGILILLGLIVFVASEKARDLITGFLGTGDNAVLELQIEGASADSATYQVGNQFNVNVLLSSGTNGGDDVVAVGAYIEYDSAAFKVVSVNTTNSPFWTDNSCVYNSGPCEIVNYNGSQNNRSAPIPDGQIEIVQAKPTPGLHVDLTPVTIAAITFEAVTQTSPSNDNITFLFDATIPFASGDSDVIKLETDPTVENDILSGVSNVLVTIEAASYNPDVNSDGTVDFNDLADYVFYYRNTDIRADVDGTGTVDFNDLADYVFIYRGVNP